MSAVPAVLVGNVATDPVLKHTGTGTPYVRFRVACNERWRNADGDWIDREPVFWQCEAWSADAEIVAKEATLGRPVIVTGTFRTQNWTTDDGERRSRTYVAVQAFGVNALLAAKRASGDTPTGPSTPAPTPPAADGPQADAEEPVQGALGDDDAWDKQ